MAVYDFRTQTGSLSIRGESGKENGEPRPIGNLKCSCSLGCEKIPAVQHGDDLAACEQFFEIVAIAQFLIVEDAFPESGSNGAKFGGVKEIRRGNHELILSTHHAMREPNQDRQSRI